MNEARTLAEQTPPPGRPALHPRERKRRLKATLATQLRVRDKLRQASTMKKAPDPIDKHVGSRVRARRLMLHMSQEKLGNAIGLTFQQVQKYENGRNRIGASRLQGIAQILQAPVAFFFEGAPPVTGQSKTDDDAPSHAYVAEYLASSDGRALTRAFTRLQDAELRRRIVALVEAIEADAKH